MRRMDEDRLLRIAEVAKVLGISSRSVWRLIASSELPRPVKILGSSRLPESELAKYVERLKNARS